MEANCLAYIISTVQLLHYVMSAGHDAGKFTGENICFQSHIIIVLAYRKASIM
jgi:hypothetical protein